MHVKGVAHCVPPGDYVVVVPIAEGHKVQAEIVHILYPPQIKHLKDESLWYVCHLSFTSMCNCRTTPTRICATVIFSYAAYCTV